jgi:DNA invertase Pin-like site-specific DNA recombinase
MPKAYSYLRFSTPEQMRGDSFRRQSTAAREYAARHRLDLDEGLTFQDLGKSGFRGQNLETGRLGDFKEAVEAGLVESGSYLLVESLDRISRQTARKALRVLEDICEAGITVVTLVDGRAYTQTALDSDPMALLMSLLTFMRANEESETKSHRLKAAWEAKRSRVGDRPLTSRCPSWLRLNKAEGEFEVIEHRAEVVRRMFAMTLDGVSPQGIVLAFNSEGIPPFGDSPSSARKAPFWRRSYVLKVLHNPAAIGTIVPHKIEYRDGKKHRVPLQPVERYFPPVIDADTFQAVQGVRAAANPRRGRHVKAPLGNIFGGLALCPLCGSTMTRTNKSTRRGSGPYRYLICSKAKAGAGCEYRAVPYDDVEGVFLAHWGKLMDEAPSESVEEERIREDLARLEAGRSALEDDLENLLDALAKAKSQPAPLVARIEELGRYREETLAEERGLVRQLEALSPSILQHRLGLFADAMSAEPVDRARANAALRGLFTGIVINYRTGEAVFRWQVGGETSIMFRWLDDSAPGHACEHRSAT